MAGKQTSRFFRLTRGGWGMLLVCVLLSLGAINADLNLTYLLASLLIAIFLAALVGPYWGVHGLEYRRAFPGDAWAGEPFVVDLWVHSKRRTAARRVTVDEPLGAGKGARKFARKLIPVLPPRGRARLSCAIPPRQRGAYPLPILKLTSRFPFGVAEYGMQRPGDGELLVFPARCRLSLSIRAMLNPKGDREGGPARTGRRTHEFRSLREYKPGDNIRMIHWRVSAHLGTLFVRETERERSAPVTLVLDSRIPESTPPNERARAVEALEKAVAFAAEVCRATVEGGNAVHLLAFFPEPRLLRCYPVGAEKSTGGDAVSFRGLLEALARLKPATATDAAGLVSDGGSAGLSGRIVAVTPTARTAAGLRGALPAVADLHVADSPAFSRVCRLTAGTGVAGP